MLPLKLHMTLFLPSALSSWVLVALSIMLLGFGLSGVYLWWPGRKRIKTAVAIPKPQSPISLRRCHAGIGFWTSPLIILAGITGLMLTKFDWAEAITAPLGASAEFDPATAPKAVCSQTATTSAGDALTTARAKYPGRELASMFLPSATSPVYSIWLRPADSTIPARGNTEVIVDVGCGNVPFARNDAEMKAGDTVLTYLVELHNARLLGLIGEGLIVIQGLALTILPLAGIMLWLWKRRRRRSARSIAESGLRTDDLFPAE